VITRFVYPKHANPQTLGERALKSRHTAEMPLKLAVHNERDVE